MNRYTVTLIGTGFMRNGDHTVRLTAELIAGTPETAVSSLLGLLTVTGSFQVADVATGHTVVVDRSAGEEHL